GPVIAMFTTDFCRLHTLAVDDCQAGLAFTSCRLAHLFAQCRMNVRPRLIPTPLVIVIIDAIEVRVFMRQICPCTARPQHIQDRVHYRSHLQRRWTTWPNLPLHYHRFDELPLLIPQVAFISAAFVTHLSSLLLARIGCLATPNFTHQEPLISLIFKCALGRNPRSVKSGLDEL